MARALRLRALDIGLDLARAHVVEGGRNNRGPVVDNIIGYAHGDLGEPWCVDFDIWCYGHAGSRFLKPGSPRAVRLMNAHGVRPVKAAKPGDPVRFTFDHTGLLIGFRRYVAGKLVPCPRWLATHIKTVEGNTGSSGQMLSDSRDGGDGVYVKVRPLWAVADFLRVYG